MSASRELQRQLKRLELCLPRSAKKPPAGPGSVLNKDSNAKRVVIQGFQIGGGLDEEAALLAER